MRKNNGNIIRLLGITLMAVLTTLLVLNPVGAEAKAKEKVLLDADMVDLFDDGVAMMLLLRSPKVELVGVTTVTGNTWAATGAASAIRQLEIMGRTDVPVAVGTTPEHVMDRFEDIFEEMQVFGRGFDTHLGAAGVAEPSGWESEYELRYGESPSVMPIDEEAADFIIRTIKENPNEITIAAIGPGSNLAAALDKAPEIAGLAKRIIYMSGAFFQQGNVTPAAEFNVWIDPSGTREVVRAPFKEQIFLPLDACEKMVLSQQDYQDLQRRITKPTVAELMRWHYLTAMFASGSDKTFIWDVLVAAVIIDPSVIEEEVTLPVDVNDYYSPAFGQTLAYRGVGPEGSQTARIVLTVNQEKVMRMVRQLFDTL